MESVGACDAKTHPPRLLDRVARGEEIQITPNDRPVARLVPEPSRDTKADVAESIAQVREFRKGRRFGGDLTIRQLVEEGRR